MIEKEATIETDYSVGQEELLEKLGSPPKIGLSGYVDKISHYIQKAALGAVVGVSLYLAPFNADAAEPRTLETPASSEELATINKRVGFDLKSYAAHHHFAPHLKIDTGPDGKFIIFIGQTHLDPMETNPITTKSKLNFLDKDKKEALLRAYESQSDIFNMLVEAVTTEGRPLESMGLVFAEGTIELVPSSLFDERLSLLKSVKELLEGLDPSSPAFEESYSSLADFVSDVRERFSAGKTKEDIGFCSIIEKLFHQREKEIISTLEEDPQLSERRENLVRRLQLSQSEYIRSGNEANTKQLDAANLLLLNKRIKDLYPAENKEIHNNCLNVAKKLVVCLIDIVNLENQLESREITPEDAMSKRADIKKIAEEAEGEFKEAQRIRFENAVEMINKQMQASQATSSFLIFGALDADGIEEAVKNHNTTYSSEKYGFIELEPSKVIK